MPQSFGDHPIGACLSCGQHMRLPIALDAPVACPRCGKVANALDLIPLATPISQGALQPSNVEIGSAATLLDVGSTSGPGQTQTAGEPTVAMAAAHPNVETNPTAPTTPASGTVGVQPRVAAQPAPDSSVPILAEREDARSSTRESRVLKLCDGIDRRLAGRRTTAVAILVFVGGVVGPFVDWTRSSSSTQPVCTVVVTNVLFVVLWALFFAWLGGLRDEEGNWNGWLFISRLKVLWVSFWQGFAELRDSDMSVKLANFGTLAIAGGCVILAGRSVGIVASVVLDAEKSFSDLDQKLVLGGVGLCVLGVVLWAKALFGGGTDATEDDTDQVCTDLGQLPALLDLQERHDQNFGDRDPLRVALSALAKWRVRKTQIYQHEKYYQAALERHFRRYAKHLKCRREVWMGEDRQDGIADLILGNLVLIEVKRGFSKTSADRAIGQLFAYKQKWEGKPKLLVIFDASRRDVFESTATSTLKNLHAQAETITVRM